MIDDSNPFAEPKAAPHSASGNAKAPWTIVAVLGVVLVVVLLLWARTEGKLRELQLAQSDFDAAKTNLANALAENQQDKDQITALRDQVATLEKEKDAAGKMAKGLEDEMRSDLESKDVTISNLQGKLTVSILDRVMFDSGEAFMKPDGEAVLRKIANILAEHADLKIQVIGHTDNVPIRNRFASNWELSTARALSAVHFLTEKAGVNPRRVGAVGYGEYRPIADNATAEGRARNRRIAITILPDELAVADAAPQPKPADKLVSAQPPANAKPPGTDK